MNSMYFTEEHSAFRQSFRDFLQKEVVPFIDKWEKQGFVDREIWKKFGDMGYFGLNYPEEFGGLNLDLFYTTIFLEELQRVNSGGFAAAIWAHTYLAMTHIEKEGSQKIKEDYLHDLEAKVDELTMLCNKLHTSEEEHLKAIAELTSNNEQWEQRTQELFVTL